MNYLFIFWFEIFCSRLLSRAQGLCFQAFYFNRIPASLLGGWNTFPVTVDDSIIINSIIINSIFRLLPFVQTKLFRVIISFNGIWSGCANSLLVAGYVRASTTLIFQILISINRLGLKLYKVTTS
jgi:hypothetical protein